MKGCLKFRDTVELVYTEPNGYGTEIPTSSGEVKCIIEMNTGYSHSANQDAVDSDAILFFPSGQPFIEQNFYRLEEMLVKTNLYGVPNNDAWFKITSVDVYRDHQQCNKIDHVEVTLKKTVETPGESGVSS